MFSFFSAQARVCRSWSFNLGVLLNAFGASAKTGALGALCTLCTLGTIGTIGTIGIFGLSSCTSTTDPQSSLPATLDSSVIVVNQGAFGLDNASLSRIHPDNTVDLSWFAAANASRKLGGTANDIAFMGDTAFVSVTKSHSIEVMNAKSGVHLGTMLLSVSQDPWDIEIISPTLACVSTTNGDGVQFFNPKTMTLLDHVLTGPATQGVASTSTLVFVANSGYGTLRDTVKGAGTVSVIDIASRSVVGTLNVGKNVTEVQLSTDKKRLYAYYQELYTNPSALQGIVEYDVATLKETARWTFIGSGYMNVTASGVYVIGKISQTVLAQQVLLINPLLASPTPAPVMNIAAGVSINGLTVDTRDGSFWISDAADYTSNGSVIHYSAQGAILHTHNVGPVPVKVAIFP
jgi:hypothetical protein